MASTTSMMSVPHHECERTPFAPTGSTSLSDTRASTIGGLRSDCHSQAMTAPTAVMPQAQANHISFTVISRKKPAVPAAAIRGSQLSAGRIIR